ncbi:MAG: DUF2804 domain-containing protein [Myxococcota bacterium]|nr:DUF2804 domain-containing protein [Myxococcota bacterium]
MRSPRDVIPALRTAPGFLHNEAGQPLFGTYQGVIPDVDLSRLGGAYQLSGARRLFKEKKWHYQLVATPEVLVAYAVVDLGYAANAFITAVDLRTREVVADQSFIGVPGPLAGVNNRPGEGLAARLISPLGASFAVSRAEGNEKYRLSVEVLELPIPRRISLRGEVLAAGGPPALTVVAPVGEDGVINVTQKWAALLAFGHLKAGGRRYLLDGGVAGLDYTHGYLARHTAWRWAMGLGRLPDGTPVGLNLVEGFNEDNADANENGLWVGNRLIPLDRARFDFNRQDLLDDWRIRTTDGSVDLRFKPLHVHREERDLKVIKSRFAQPFGTFTGTVRVEGATLPVNLAGVTEDQDMIW